MSPNAMKSVHKIEDNISELTEKIREKSHTTSGIHNFGKVGQDNSGLTEFARDVARKVGAAAGYLTRSDMNTMSRDTMRLCRQYPAQSIATALALGFLMGRMRRS